MQNISSITVAILAGGLGTRLRRVVPDCPKVLAEVCKKPFLSYLLDQLAVTGFKYVVLCTGYLGDKVKKVFGDKYGPLHLAYSHEKESLGTAGALRLATPLFKSDSILVMNGDSYCWTDLEEFWEWHEAKKANATLLLTKMTNTKRYGRVDVDDSGSILNFSEKSEEGLPGWINAGIYLLKHEMILKIPPNRAVSLENEIFPEWIGHGLYGCRSQEGFLDIGTPGAFAEANKIFAGATQIQTGSFSHSKSNDTVCIVKCSTIL